MGGGSRPDLVGTAPYWRKGRGSHPMLGEERLLVLYIRWDSVSNKGGAEYLYLESDSGRGDRSSLPAVAGFRGSERHCSEEGPCRGWYAGYSGWYTADDGRGAGQGRGIL